MALVEIFKKYENWVCTNPNVVSDMETLVTWSSYFIAGKINKSPVVSELVYSLSKLLTLFNDRIIEKSLDKYEVNGKRDTMELWLTILHHCEVFVELCSIARCGDRGKWRIATTLQLFRSLSSLVLIFKYKQFPISNPPLPRTQRKQMLNQCAQVKDEGFVLKRSGRVVRKTDGSPSVLLRNWQSLEEPSQKTARDNNIKLAEALYVMKPLVHLGSMACFGRDSWRQWLVPFGMDLLALKFYSKELDTLTYQQKLEISRRKLSLILYLLRSPMYNKYSKNMIERFLRGTTKAIPFTGFLCNPIIQYLNYWQEIYFYMWST